MNKIQWSLVLALGSALGAAACGSPDDYGCTGGAVPINNECKCLAPLIRFNGECVPDPHGYDASVGAAAGEGDPWTSADAGARDAAAAGGIDAGALERDAALTPLERDAAPPPVAVSDSSTSVPPESDGAVQSARDAGAQDGAGANDAGVPAAMMPPPPACVPVAEVCGDRKDNDCDGVIDNGVKNACGACAAIANAPGVACSNGGQGLCAKAGTYVCMGETTVCNAPPPSPGAEECDGIDNDCDGSVDEGFTKNACGGCKPLANAKDAPCSAGVAECASAGVYACMGTDATSCTAVAKAPSAEVCGDSKDNDCDGMVDEACPKCGNGIVESGEACEGDTWHCSPDCKKRSIYTACDGAAGALCDESTVACYENLCVPQVSNYDVASCPKVVGGYQVAITFAQGCVLSCNASSDCPPHLPRCMDNPFVDADPRETKRYCWRSF